MKPESQKTAAGIRIARYGWLPLAALALAFFCFAQAPPDTSQQDKPAQDKPAADKPAEKKAGQDKPAEEKPIVETYNPLRAHKDMEVADFYIKKGRLDAAIERYQDAIVALPNFALPHKKLAEAYEKKGNKTLARKEYEKYLEVFPHAPDKKEILKHIDKLPQ